MSIRNARPFPTGALRARWAGRMVATVALLVMVAGTSGSAAAQAASMAADSAAVVGALDAFHAALAAGDSAAVTALLEPSAVILEAGGAESRSEYLSHHMPSDMAFAAAIERHREVQRVRLAGDMAWVATTSALRGEFRGQGVDVSGAELAVLVRRNGAWRIAAIHWSSRSRNRS